MNFTSFSVFLFLALLTTATSATDIMTTPEPMSFAEKKALVDGDGARRSLRELQSSLTYKSQICRKKTRGVFPCSTAGSSCQPSQWDYWYMNLEAGTAYTIEVDRFSCGLDPALTFYEGYGTKIPSGCFSSNGSAELTPIAAADDNDEKPTKCSKRPAPWADPKIVVTPSTSGIFTLAVINYASDPDSCTEAAGYRYTVEINPRPSCA